MSDDFQYDVFVSHSAKDKAVVRGVAERLRGDGLRVWFDEWEIPSDVPLAHRMGEGPGVRAAKIEAGLEHSRVHVLCMSAQALGSDPGAPGLEAGTSRFRDALNHQRRFIPLRLDDAPIKGSLKQFPLEQLVPKDTEDMCATLAVPNLQQYGSRGSSLSPTAARAPAIATRVRAEYDSTQDGLLKIRYSITEKAHDISKVD